MENRVELGFVNPAALLIVREVRTRGTGKFFPCQRRFRLKIPIWAITLNHSLQNIATRGVVTVKLRYKMFEELTLFMPLPMIPGPAPSRVTSLLREFRCPQESGGAACARVSMSGVLGHEF